MTKILLVEDDKSLREIYGVRLLAEGYDIVSAGDGEEALAMAIKEKPTLIISDVMMPKISGFDMLDILRSTTETRDIKVIMMTALSSDDQRNRGEQLGADRYLVKSQVGIEDVVRTVHEVLGDSAGAAGAATATPATPAEPAATPAEPTAPATDSTPAEPTASDDASDIVPATSTPGNEDAGPLPPQPTITGTEESSLPQPTAPFSSPRPATLGENIVQPVTDTTPAEPVVSPETIAQELQASPEPITSQVDDAPLTPSTPSATDTLTSSVQPPAAPAVDLEAPVVPGATPPTVTPADLSAAPADATDKKDDSLTPPTVPPTTPAL